ncbi:hypothetical protein PMSD_09975 [Paenibacillus macquariensis subsp. defensor]|nr:hypothetical protein PMSD_09975 [Paenibacillus macquariensis subsp. defensor]
MKQLDEDQRERMYSKRHYELTNMVEVAVKLNCKHEHIVQAQIGEPIPTEVYDAVIQWLR